MRFVHASLVTLAAASGMLACRGTASADLTCDATRKIYATTFAKPDSHWDVHEPGVKFNNSIQMIMPPSSTRVAYYRGGSVADGSICATIDHVGPLQKMDDAGVVFWSSANDDYYAVLIDAQAGTAAIAQFRHGKPVRQTPATTFTGTALATVHPTTFGIVLHVQGNDAVAFVDGTEIGHVRVNDVAKPWSFGFRGGSGPTSGALWRLRQYMVTKP